MGAANTSPSAWRRPQIQTAMAGLAAAALAAAVTRHGALLDPDSSAYLWSSARFRTDPGDVLDPVVTTDLSIRHLFAPLYPVVLAIAGVFGDDRTAARVVGCVLAGAWAALTFHLVRRAASAATAAAVLAVLVASRGHLLVNFGFVMSEGLYLTLAIAAVAALSPVPQQQPEPRPDRERDLTTGRVVLASTLAGGALATRLVGLGVVIAVAAAVAALVGTPTRLRARMAAISLAIGLAPTIAWEGAIRLAGGGGSRHLGYRRLTTADLTFVDAVTHPFLPRQAIDALGTGGSRAVGAVVLAGAAAWTARRLSTAARAGATGSQRTSAVLLLVGWGHLATLVAARAFVDLMIPLGGRHTMLWFTCLVTAAAIDLHHLAARRGDVAWARPAAWVVGCILLVGAAPGFARTLADPSEAWSNLGQDPPSTLAEAADRVAAADQLIYTNREDIVHLETGRSTAALPLPVDQYSGEANEGFASAVDDMAEDVRAGGAIVVLFTDDPVWVVPAGALADDEGLAPIHTDAEGVILGSADA